MTSEHIEVPSQSGNLTPVLLSVCLSFLRSLTSLNLGSMTPASWDAGYMQQLLTLGSLGLCCITLPRVKVCVLSPSFHPSVIFMPVLHIDTLLFCFEVGSHIAKADHYVAQISPERFTWLLLHLPRAEITSASCYARLH